MTNLVISPHVPFTDIDGSPLNEGFIFIGEKDKDPIQHPIAVYWDEAKIELAAQPIRTRNGFVINEGVISNIFIDQSNCSIAIKNKNQSIIHTELNSIQFSSVSGVQGLVQLETTRAMAAESALNTSIINEVTRATVAEGLLQTQINTNGVGNRAYLTYADMVADTANIPAKSKVTVTNDSTASNNGDYQYDGANFTKSSYDPVAQSKAYTDALSVSLDAIRVNSNKNYPMQERTRDGITSVNSTTYNSSVLDVRVIGDVALIKDKYFKIEYLQNGAVAGGSDGYGIIISEFKRSTFATASERTQIHHYTDAQKCDYVLDGKVHTFTITPALRPNLRFVITVDTVKMPAAGNSIDIGSVNTRPQWSYVIHPNCYIPIDMSGATSGLDSLKVNSSKNYPLKSMTRAGTLSPTNAGFNDCILKLRIVNAVPGKYYRLAYFKNGNTTIAGALDGWAIEEIDQLNYETANNTAFRVIDYIHDAPDITRDGTIQTVKVQSATRANFQVYITLDTAKLPPITTPINALTVGNSGFSWIIDPSCYEYELPINVNITGGTGFQYSIAANNDVLVAYQSGAAIWRLTFGVNGFNDLPNIKKIERSPLQGTPSFSVISETTTDYLPPLVIKAESGGDGSTTGYYTGGNHGSSGGASGDQTARNVLYQINVDGQIVPNGTTKSGFAANIKLLIVNELMAYNTITLSRYVVRQTFKINFNATGINVESEVKALENITISTDNGLQLYTGGWQGTQLFIAGSNTSRVAFNSEAHSGFKSTNPNAFAVVFQTANGQLSMWTDRSFEAGDGRYVQANAPLIRGGGAANTKFYSAIVTNSAAVLMTAGQNYKWRGGYAIQSTSQPVGYDSVFDMKDQKCVVKTASDFSVI